MGKQTRKTSRQAWRGKTAYVEPTMVLETFTGQRIEFSVGEKQLTRDAPVDIRQAVRIRVSAKTGKRIKRRDYDLSRRNVVEVFALFGHDVEPEECDRVRVADSWQARMTFVVAGDFSAKQLAKIRIALHQLVIDTELADYGYSIRGKVSTDDLMPVGRHRDYSARRGEGSAEPHVGLKMTANELDHTDKYRSEVVFDADGNPIGRRKLSGHYHDDRHSEAK